MLTNDAFGYAGGSRGVEHMARNLIGTHVCIACGHVTSSARKRRDLVLPLVKRVLNHHDCDVFRVPLTQLVPEDVRTVSVGEQNTNRNKIK
jgi:hypothetical protein